ncbi:hypothetical protein BJ973_009222 [Actinoplanes tereljensis]|uniref:ABC3 transporter permease C-terminal domain-containing protein n=1 Tax=Paractinoplanes tereljensis TaxID=571912 RepID=A0A919NFT4_9ACTN|nr:FtsX-like permease family protein [Actinoplanes tereljensis]GIF17814.1 hypothetical protein Ate02nite_05440 [Actinoplanes tereljensis]
MFTVIWGAVRTRTAQVLTVLILTALAASVAAAAPWFALVATDRSAAADVAAAPAEQRTLSIRQRAETNGDPGTSLRQFASTVRDQLPLPAADPVTGLVQPLNATHGTGIPAIQVAYRDDFCAHLRLEGPCPAAPYEAAISRNAAQQLGVSAGQTIELRNTVLAEPVRLKVVALYELAEPGSPYWSNPLFRKDTGLDPTFTPLDTFQNRQLWQPTLAYDVQIPESLLRGDHGYRLGPVLRAAAVRLDQADLRLVNLSGPLLDTIGRDRDAIERGVLVAMVQILILAWFAIGLAGRYTGRDRRGDAALLKLRGSTRWSMLRLALGQHLVPLALGALAGLPLGYLLARVLAGPVTRPEAQRTALLLSVAAAAAVLAGGLLVLAVIEGVVLRRPVADLLRNVGGGRGDWRSGLADLLLLAIAVAAVYQARSGVAGAGLALAAPALVALAVALLLARLLGRAADRGGGAAVRTGRLRLGLTAVQVSRQPGSDRVFALVVVAVAVFGTALGGWWGERTARIERSASELGAARVLTVQAPSRTALLRAVRAADPAGDRAMAVVVDRTSTLPVLAVDSTRLAAVARWRPEYGPRPVLATAPAPVSAPITGTGLSLRLRYDSKVPAALNLVLQNESTGAPVRVRFGVPAQGEQTLAAPVDGCATGGCRILRWELTSPPQPDGRMSPPPAGAAATVQGLTQQGPDAVVLDATNLGDIARWRPGTLGAALDVTATGGTLRLSVDANPAGLPQIGDAVYAVDTTLPLPIVKAGPPLPDWQFTEPALFAIDGPGVPVRIAGTARALPVVGRTGVLVDLDASRRILGDTDAPGDYQVWLSAEAGAGTVRALTAAGLTVTQDASIGGRAAVLADQAPAVTSRFALVAGVVALLLAAAAIGVAGAVDRRTRLEQLRALRVQGLAGRVAVAVAYAGTAGLIGAGVLAGIGAAVLARPLARVTVPAFTDGWDVLPLPSALGGVTVAIALPAALVVLGLTGLLAVLPLIRRLRAEDTA